MDPEVDVKERAQAFTSFLAGRSRRFRDEALGAVVEEGAEATRKVAGEDSLGSRPHSGRAAPAPQQLPTGQSSLRSVSGASGKAGWAGGHGGLSDELAALLGGLSPNTFPDMLRELMAAPTQVLLPADVDPQDAAALQRLSGCSAAEAARLLDCLALLRAAAEALPDPQPSGAEAGAAAGQAQAGAQTEVEGKTAAPDGSREGLAAANEQLRPGSGASSGAAGRPRSVSTAAKDDRSAAGSSQHSGVTAAGEGRQAGVTSSGAPGTAAGVAAGAAPAAAGAGADPGPSMMPSPQQLTRHLGALANLVNDYPGLRTAVMARDAPAALLRVMMGHPERAVAANSALALAALAAGPPAHKTALIAGGAVPQLLAALRGETAAAIVAVATGGGDAPGIAANACNAIANLVSGHAAGAAALAAAGGIGTILGLLGGEQPGTVRTNAAGVVVALTAAHESYRGAVVAAGGVAALAAGMLRGPEAPACNAVTALFNLAASSKPHLRPSMAAAEGQLAIVPKLLVCMCGRNQAGAADESVAAATAARINASAVLLELCKDPLAAPLLAAPALAVPSALAALAAGRLPPPRAGDDPVAAAAAAADILSGGVELLYPVPPVVRGNAVLCLIALARVGREMQMELGRCGALGTLLELIGPGQDPAMQINAANAICSLAAVNADIHAALVSARCVPLLARLLQAGGDAARANVCAVFVTMMVDEGARRQLQECGGLAMLIRLVAAVLDERKAAGLAGASAADPGGVLCNSAGALAEAAKHEDLRRGLVQLEFGESLGTLLRCLKEAPDQAQVNAAAAIFHLCREQAIAVQLARQHGLEVLGGVIGAESGEGGAAAGGASARLRHNATRALARLEEQLAAAEVEAQQAPGVTTVLVTPRRGAADDSATGGGGGGGGDGDGAREGGGSRRLPRKVWEGGAPAIMDSAASLAVTPSLRAAEDEDEDAVSTVIAPPLPLAAY